MRGGEFEGKLVWFDSVKSNNNRVIFRGETRSEDNNSKKFGKFDIDILQEICTGLNIINSRCDQLLRLFFHA